MMTRRALPLFVLAALSLLAFPTIGFAQVQDRPSRPYQGLFGGGRAPSPTRTEQELSLTTTLLGAYGETAQSGQEGEVSHLGGQGTSGILQTVGSYFIGNTNRSLSASGRGYAAAYDSADTRFGGDVVFQGRTNVGRMIALAASQDARNEPFLTIGEFAGVEPVLGDASLPDSDPTLGVVTERRWSYRTNASAAVTKSWTPRHSTSARYEYSLATYPANLGFDNTAHLFTADHSWRYSRPATLRIGYIANSSTFASQSDPALTVQTVEAGVDYRHRISPTRSLTLSGTLGGSHTETGGVGDTPRVGQWAPSGRGSVQIDIGRAWMLTGEYTRTASVLDRVSVETFFSDTLLVQAGGMIGRRLDAVVSGGLARGSGTAGESTGTYRSSTMTGQLRWALTGWMATLVSYSYYDYDLADVEVLAVLPTQSSRHGLRVGLTLWVPFIGGGGPVRGER